MSHQIDYDSLEIEKLNAGELFTYLVSSELDSMKDQRQGVFYYRICFHPHFKKTMGSTLNGVDHQLIIEAFYHCLRNNDIFKFNEKFYPLFLKAIEKLLPDLAENAPYICGFNRFKAYLLFEVLTASDLHKLEETSVEDFLGIMDFIRKADSYTAYPNVRKNHDKLTPFLANEKLMSRIRKGILYYSDFKEEISLISDFPMTMAASLVLLLKDDHISSKNALIELHQQKLSRNIVWVLGSFYKDFKRSEENKRLLADLYTTYSDEWVNEYA